MRILILTQYFWPESFIINDFVKGLVAEGHSVSIATGKPNYPSGTIFPGYRSSGILVENFTKEIEVFRIPLRPRGKGGGLGLALNYLSFVCWGLLIFPFLLRGRKFDHILVFAPSPIFQAIPAIVLKYLKRSTLSIWVQDLWPDTLLATGFVQNRLAISIVRQIVKCIYFFTDFLFAQSEAFIKPLSLLAKAEKIIYFPNCFPKEENQNQDGNSKISPELIRYLDQNFCFVFAGNIGSAQSIASIMEAAELLKQDPKSKIGIVIVGSGSLSDWVQAQVHAKGLTNVMIAGRYPMDAMPAIFAKAKVLLVTLKDHPTLHLTIPSKIQAYLAARKPILGALPGEGARILRESNGAVVIEPDHGQKLAEAMISISKMSNDQLLTLSDNAYSYFLKHFEMSTQVKIFGSLLLKTHSRN